MKTKLFIALCVLLLAGCATTSNPIHKPASDPQEIRLIVNGVEVDGKNDGEKIHKTMQIESTDLQLSRNCRLLGDTAYLKLTSISSYNMEDLWSDSKILQHKAIQKIVVYMNNPGGEAFQGMGITDELRLMKEKGVTIEMEGRGLIASAAVPVFVAGTKGKRVVSKSTVFMIHPAGLLKGGFVVQREELKDLESQAKMIRLLNNNYAEAISSNSNLDKKEVLEMLKCDNWITAQQALEMGFVDEIR